MKIHTYPMSGTGTNRAIETHYWEIDGMKTGYGVVVRTEKTCFGWRTIASVVKYENDTWVRFSHWHQGGYYHTGLRRMTDGQLKECHESSFQNFAFSGLRADAPFLRAAKSFTPELFD